MALQVAWTSHCKTPEDKQEFEQLLRGSTKVLDRLLEILYNIGREYENSATADYDSPSWAYKQADRLGRKAAIERIIKLVKLDND